MIRAILVDFSRVLLHPKNITYTGKLNDLHRKLSVDNSYNILDHFILNEELIDYLKQLNGTYKLYIYTTDVIQDDPEIRKVIDPIFYKVYRAKDIGLSKQDPKSYEFIIKDLELEPEEILFIDDTLGNIKAAQAVGIHTIQFTLNKDLFEKLRIYLGSTK